MLKNINLKSMAKFILTVNIFVLFLLLTTQFSYADMPAYPREAHIPSKSSQITYTELLQEYWPIAGIVILGGIVIYIKKRKA